VRHFLFLINNLLKASCNYFPFEKSGSFYNPAVRIRVKASQNVFRMPGENGAASHFAINSSGRAQIEPSFLATISMFVFNGTQLSNYLN
jgi:hypothetical protein